jgi:hypothetical protein
MFYKIKACNDLKSAHEERHGFKYDLVVRTRADIVYHSRIDLPALDRDKLHMPAVPAMYGCPSGANDQIAVGSSANMDAYASAIDSLHDWTRTIIGEDAGAAFRPERFLRWHVNRTGVPTERLAARYSLHRLNGRHVAIQ